ncbi:MAG: hypothetical protein HZC41_23150 [Chloroflexi bacterium]|nr:hypothetical protein [Chloroflexota bacterium]
MLANNPSITITPDKAFYRPGERVLLRVAASAGTQVEATIRYLADTITTMTAPLNNGQAELIWTPPQAAPRGYGLDVRVLGADGQTLALASGALDVLEHWMQAPRYGFLSHFEPGRDNITETMERLARYHVNGLQFYDWQHKHEDLLPEADIYTDFAGREMSVTTVKRLIEAAHAHNIAAMPYTAIYGASVGFYRQHPDWALFRAPGQPYEFGDNFLIIMDPTPGSRWATHLLGEFARVLDNTAFDGIHIDQYGAPKNGLNAAGEKVELESVFPAFINVAAEVVQAKRGDGGVTIFNAVGNWPVDTVAPAEQDAVYIEVWEPYRKFLDLHKIVARAEQLGGGKPVIIAAYIQPERAHNVRLANALIFASGGYHLELGEPGAMLADPYFPKYGMMDEALQGVMQRYYDFLVRYENVLSLDTTDATETRAAALTIEGVKTDGRRSQERVAVIVREGAGREAFSLVNLVGIDTGDWDRPVTQAPTPMRDLKVRIYTKGNVTRVWAASPDGEDIRPQMLDYTKGQDGSGAYIEVRLPRLDYWTMMVLDYAT